MNYGHWTQQNGKPHTEESVRDAALSALEDFRKHSVVRDKLPMGKNQEVLGRKRCLEEYDAWTNAMLSSLDFK